MQKKKTLFFLIDLQHWEFTGPNIFKSRWRVTFFHFFLLIFLSYHKKYIIFFLPVKFEYSSMKNEEIVANSNSGL